jgi:hypothetical protein
VRFETREELDAWLENEAYVINSVWESIEIRTVNLIDVAKLKAS